MYTDETSQYSQDELTREIGYAFLEGIPTNQTKFNPRWNQFCRNSLIHGWQANLKELWSSIGDISLQSYQILITTIFIFCIWLQWNADLCAGNMDGNRWISYPAAKLQPSNNCVSFCLSTGHQEGSMDSLYEAVQSSSDGPPQPVPSRSSSRSCSRSCSPAVLLNDGTKWRGSGRSISMVCVMKISYIEACCTDCERCGLVNNHDQILWGHGLEKLWHVTRLNLKKIKLIIKWWAEPVDSCLWGEAKCSVSVNLYMNQLEDFVECGKLLI